VERVSWTYELPPAGAPDVGLEQYQLATPEGDVWKAVVLLEHDGRLFVAAAPSGAALRRRLVAVPWEAVEGVDHDALTVRVGSLADAVELDPGQAVENEPAEARRVEELPAELVRTQPTGDVAGPMDRMRLILGLGSAAVGFVTLLIAIAVIDRAGEAWAFALLAVPAAFFLAAGALSISAWRRPYAPAARGAGRPRPR
jgi:hypothetical protein